MRKAVRRTALHRCLVGLTTAITCGLATAAYAEVHVEGGPEAVRVTTSRDAIVDVLAAVATTFNARYRTAIPLDAQANAAYSGSFAQVISRLLDGYNYVVKREQGTIEIVVFGTRGEVAIPPPAPKAPPVKGIVSQWR
jgi:hypothetical protein